MTAIGARPTDAQAVPKRVALALAVALVWWLVDLALLRTGTPHPLDDLWEDGLIARALLAGHGFWTPMLYPPLWAMRDPATLTVPVLVHGPLLPLLLTPMVAVFGARAIDHVAWLAAAAAWLTAYFTARTLQRAAGATVAAVAVLLLTFSPILLDAVNHSFSVVVGALALAIALDALLRREPRGVTAGLALGLGYLTRSELMLVAPLVALAAGLAPRQWLHFGAAFLVCAVPWWAHHFAVVGSPFFNLSSYTVVGFSHAFPGSSLMRDFALTPDRWPAFLQSNLGALPPKWLESFPRALKRVVVTPGVLTGWLVGFGLFAWLPRPGYRRLASAAMFIALIPVALMTVTVPQPLYLVTFLPLFAIAASIGAGALVEWFVPTVRIARWWPAVVVLLAFAGVIPTLLVARTEARAARDLLASERAALAKVPATGVSPLFSDRPDFVAWTTGRPALWMTSDEYDALYPRFTAEHAARPAGLPAVRDSNLTWFHDGHWAAGRRAR
ncbi:MAG: hypothetical protein HOP12_02665 [Candidatus Eisenbacteria bacterium]|uniref:Glycosyltransferase RgtA/B/C/D-like domain-containing protein n=1 Tax=Eiseniibacteriota bacterium TaxID=2212470 RepID=A0A849SCE6_UNCEI|nr:hypothetical protein [Candidatus Eisenbacteria bacterium]